MLDRVWQLVLESKQQQQYFRYIVEVSVIGGGKRSTVTSNSEILCLFHLNISVYYGNRYNNIHDSYNPVFPGEMSRYMQ
jgi:hypothetical protein